MFQNDLGVEWTSCKSVWGFNMVVQWWWGKCGESAVRSYGRFAAGVEDRILRLIVER